MHAYEKKPKKICYITTIHRTIESFILKSAEYLHENTDWDISVICDYNEEFEKRLPEYIQYYPVKMKRGISIAGIKAMLQMCRIFKAEQFDLIQYSTPNASLYAAIASKLVKVKVRNYHLMGFRYLGNNGISRVFLKWIERMTCTLSTNIECVSKSNLELGIKEKLFKREKATVVWNGSTGGVNLERFDVAQREKWRSELREELGYLKDDFIFGFVGRITKDKGVNELLKAFLEGHGDNKLILIGNMEREETLDKDLILQADKSVNVSFHESVMDIERYFAMIDVLVLPSYREGFGNVIIEAAAVGTPAIVSNIPGPIDAIHEGKTGIICEARNVKSLKDAMRKIKKNISQYSAKNCVDYVKENFDDKVLREKILKQKISYMK